MHSARCKAFSLVLPAVIAGALGCQQTAPTGQTDDQEQDRTIYALGTLQPSSGLISITGTPGDRLKTIDPDVQENKPAPANGLLGVLTSYDLRYAQLEALRIRRDLAIQKQQVDKLLAEAQLQAAQAKVKEAEARKAEAQLQSSQIEHLIETAAIARDELESVEELRESDPELISPHQLRKQRNRVAQAESEVKLATQRVSPLVDAADAALQAARSNVQAAEVSLASLEQNHAIVAIEKEIAVAEETLEQSLLWAPGADVEQLKLNSNPAVADSEEDGRYTVLKVFTRPGEMVSQLPVMQLGDVRQLECVAEVYEADAQNIQLNQGATITSPAFSEQLQDGLRGEVKYIASLISSPGLDARNPLAPKDRSVVEVRIAITTDDPQALEEAAQRIGLQVTVQFDAE